MLTKGASGTDRLYLILYSGDDDPNLLWFDLNEQSEFTSQTSEGRFLARKTHALIDPVKKRLVLEAGRGHPSADELAEFIEEEGRKIASFELLDLTFTPVPVPEFAQQIARLQRIQAASVVIARPNPGWTDRYNQYTQTASDSNAKIIEAGVRSGRNESLSKDEGLVADIKQWVTGIFPSIKNAKLKGLFEDSSAPIELKLTDYVETATYSVNLDPLTKQPTDSEIQKNLNSLLDSKQESHD